MSRKWRQPFTKRTTATPTILELKKRSFQGFSKALKDCCFNGGKHLFLYLFCTETLLLTTHFQTPWTPRDIWSDLTKFWGPTVGILTKNSSEKSNAPHMPEVPPPLGLTIDRCISYTSNNKIVSLQWIKFQPPVTPIKTILDQSTLRRLFELCLACYWSHR